MESDDLEIETFTRLRELIKTRSFVTFQTIFEGANLPADFIPPHSLQSNDVPHSLLADSVMYRQLDITKYLVSQGADVNQSFDTPRESGFTPIFWAVLNFDENMIQYLISVGADINAKTSRDESPICKVLRQYKDMTLTLQYLLNTLKVDWFQRGIQGDSLLHIAGYIGNLPHFKYLHEVKGMFLYDKNEFGLTPIFRACGGGIDIIHYLRYKGIDIKNMVHTEHNNVNYALWNPLHYAAERGNISIFKYLYKDVGVDINARTIFNSTWLLVAAGSNLDLVKYLVEKIGQDPHETNKLGENSVLIAAKHGKADIIQYLIKNHNVNPFCINKEKENVLTLAKKHEQTNQEATNEIWRIIDEYKAKCWASRKTIVLLKSKLHCFR